MPARLAATRAQERRAERARAIADLAQARERIDLQKRKAKGQAATVVSLQQQVDDLRKALQSVRDQIDAALNL